MVAHKDLTGLNLHEPKGIEGASEGEVYIADGDGSGSWDLVFPSGTRMLFQQTAAPTGWTKDTSTNDAGLRVVSGDVVNGGTANFSDVFAERTILQANLPSYNLSASLGVSVSVSVSVSGSLNRRNGTSGGFDGSRLQTASEGGASGSLGFSASGSGAGSGTASGSIPSGGSGTAMDFAVKYKDVIIAQKD